MRIRTEEHYIETEIPWKEPKQTKNTVETDRYYETGVVSGHSKLYELLEEFDKGARGDVNKICYILRNLEADE